jgi:hypothetical protein
MHDDVGAVRERLAEVGRSRGVVHDERDARLARDRADRGDIDHVDRGVAEGFGEDRLGIRLDRAAKILRVVGIDHRRLDADLAEVHAEHRDRAAVELRGRDDVVALLEDVEERHHLGRLPRGGRHRRAPALDRGHALLEDRGRRIRKPRVDVAERLQVEEARGVVGVVEDVRRRLVERNGARAGLRVGNLARVQAQRFEAEFAIRQ